MSFFIIAFATLVASISLPATWNAQVTFVGNQSVVGDSVVSILTGTLASYESHITYAANWDPTGSLVEAITDIKKNSTFWAFDGASCYGSELGNDALSGLDALFSFVNVAAKLDQPVEFYGKLCMVYEAKMDFLLTFYFSYFFDSTQTFAGMRLQLEYNGELLQTLDVVIDSLTLNYDGVPTSIPADWECDPFAVPAGEYFLKADLTSGDIGFQMSSAGKYVASVSYSALSSYVVDWTGTTLTVPVGGNLQTLNIDYGSCDCLDQEPINSLTYVPGPLADTQLMEDFGSVSDDVDLFNQIEGDQVSQLDTSFQYMYFNVNSKKVVALTGNAGTTTYTANVTQHVKSPNKAFFVIPPECKNVKCDDLEELGNRPTKTQKMLLKKFSHLLSQN